MKEIIHATTAVALDWCKHVFVGLLQTDSGLAQFSETLKLHDPDGYKIIVKQLDKGSNYRDVLRSIKSSGLKNIVLDCDIEVLPEVLVQAQQVGLMVSEYSFIITNLVSLVS